MKLSGLKAFECGIIADDTAVIRTPQEFIFVQNGKVERSNKILFDIEVSPVLPIPSGELYVLQKNGEIKFITDADIEAMLLIIKETGTTVITKI